MTKHVMVDLETWSTEQNAVLVAIGAVEFDPNDFGDPADERVARMKTFYQTIDPETFDSAFHISASTMKWWMSPERDDARRRLWRDWDEGACEAGIAITEFASWCKADSDDGLRVYGNGAMFDNTKVQWAHKHYTGWDAWAFYEDGCYRTIKGLAPDLKLERWGTFHHALDDAISQALHMQAVLARLGIKLS